MKWYISGVCILGLLIVIYKTSDKEITTIVQPQLSVPSISAASSDQQLLLENSRLREQVAQLTDEIKKLKDTTNNSYSSQSTVKAPNQLSADEALAKQASMQEQFQEFNNAFANGRNPIATLKTNFASEQVDDSWANTNQRQLESFFKESFTDLFPQYIECRSTRCRITLPVADQKKFSELSTTLMQGVFNNKDGIAKKIVIEPSTHDGTLNFYLARNEDVNLFK